MNVPSKGSTVRIEGYGSPLFVAGPNMEDDEPEVWVKYEGGDLDDGYGRGLVAIPWDEFTEKRIH